MQDQIFSTAIDSTQFHPFSLVEMELSKGTITYKWCQARMFTNKLFLAVHEQNRLRVSLRDSVIMGDGAIEVGDKLC